MICFTIVPRASTDTLNKTFDDTFIPATKDLRRIVLHSSPIGKRSYPMHMKPSSMPFDNSITSQTVSGSKLSKRPPTCADSHQPPRPERPLKSLHCYMIGRIKLSVWANASIKYPSLRLQSSTCRNLGFFKSWAFVVCCR